MEEKVILVDENDNEIGTEEKLKAHKGKGKLHRSFSILIFNGEGEVLIQRRAENKYHSAGLWSNTCCSHPRPGEDLMEAAHRRLKEEMGLDCELKELFNFVYKIEFDNGLSEWELDHFLIGDFYGEADPNPEEVGEWKWIDMDELRKDIEENPHHYTYWFKAILRKIDER